MSSAIPIVPGLSALASRYDALICDVWGVIHNGREAFPGVVACLDKFRHKGGLVLLLSNAPRPAAPVRAQLASLGVPETAYDSVVTSGDLVQELFAARTVGGHRLKVHHIGPERDLPLFQGFAVDRVALGEAEALLCTGPFDDTTEGPEDYRALWQDALKRKLPLICANPDLVVQRGEQLIYCAGALAQLYEQMGGAVTYLGKPHAPAYHFVDGRLRELSGAHVPAARWLAVGDGLKTDITGATRAGIDALLITGGIHEGELSDASGAPDPQRIGAIFKRDGLKAVAAMRRLVW